MLPESRFSKPIFGRSAGSTKLDRPYCSCVPLNFKTHGFLQPSALPENIVALGNLQKCVGGFLLYKFWRIFPGIFLEDFSGHFFPQK